MSMSTQSFLSSDYYYFLILKLKWIEQTKSKNKLKVNQIETHSIIQHILISLCFQALNWIGTLFPILNWIG